MQSEIESKISGVVVISKRSVVMSRARCCVLSPIACKSRNTESPRCNAHTRLEASTKQMLSSVVVSSRPEARQNNVQRRNISKTLNAPQSRISTFPESIGGVEERKSKSTQWSKNGTRKGNEQWQNARRGKSKKSWGNSLHLSKVTWQPLSWWQRGLCVCLCFVCVCCVCVLCVCFVCVLCVCVFCVCVLCVCVLCVCFVCVLCVCFVCVCVLCVCVFCVCVCSYIILYY